MTRPSVAATVAMISGGVAIAVAVVAAVAVRWLLANYLPTAPGVDPDLLRPAAAASIRNGDRHGLTVAVALGATAVAGLASFLDRAWGRAALLLVGMAAWVLVLMTVPLVRWDQLALWAVTVGDDAGGYGMAAFDEGVRFVLVDDQEVTTREYRTVLVVHLAAHAAGLAALVAAGVLQLRSRRISNSSR